MRNHRKLTFLFSLLTLGTLGLANRSWDRESPQQYETEKKILQHGEGDPDDIVIDFVDDISQTELERLSTKFNLSLELISNQSLDERFYRSHVEEASRDAIIGALQNEPLVETVEPDAHFVLSPVDSFKLDSPSDIDWKTFPNDPKFENQWHLDQINMKEAWKLSDGGGVTVAVLDTGVAFEDYNEFHKVEDLEGVTFVKPYDFVDNDVHANDDHGHGTHVAGTIAQATHNGKGVAGVARNVKIMPLKVLSGSGSGSVAGIADAIRYAADEGADVINMSLGGPFPSRVLKKAVQYAYDKGVVVVCAAGNDGRGRLGYPAGYPGAIAVAATQFDRSTTFYSNWGKGLDIAAPGGNVRVDQNGDGVPDGVIQNTIEIGNPTKSDYFGFMGTSMASPHAAGVAALVVSEGVTDPDAVENILKETSFKPSQYSQEKYGSGIIDAKAAILAARSNTGGWQFLIGLFLAGAIAASRKRLLTLGMATGVLVGASGLFWLPSVFPEFSSLFGVEMLTRGMPSWGAGILGTNFANPITFSAALPFLLSVVFLGVKKFKNLLAGLSLGVAGHLLFHAFTNIVDVKMMAFDTTWLGLNALLAVVIASLILRKDSKDS